MGDKKGMKVTKRDTFYIEISLIIALFHTVPFSFLIFGIRDTNGHIILATCNLPIISWGISAGYKGYKWTYHPSNMQPTHNKLGYLSRVLRLDSYSENRRLPVWHAMERGTVQRVWNGGTLLNQILKTSNTTDVTWGGMIDKSFGRRERRECVGVNYK